MTQLLLASTDRDWGPGPWWPLIPLFWLLVIGTVVFFARHNGWIGRSGIRTLDERFARGEIDADEYRARKNVMRGKS